MHLPDNKSKIHFVDKTGLYVWYVVGLMRTWGGGGGGGRSL